MASSSSRGGKGGPEKTESMSTQLKKWKERDSSPERTPVWTQSSSNNNSSNSKLMISSDHHHSSIERKPLAAVLVPVIYYLSRNGQLEHPHFMEILLRSSQGLFLRDFITRLNLLRGKGIADQYSWSAKRSYKNGYVWHDLCENDLIHPVNGQEYVLKGSEIQQLLDPNSAMTTAPAVAYLHVSKTSDTASSSSSGKSPRETTERSSSELQHHNFTHRRRRNQSWSSPVDLLEYKVYKAEPHADFSGKSAAADASTQTDDRRRQRRHVALKEEEQTAAAAEKIREDGHSTELSREEISPPPSESSPETLESLMKADGRLMLSSTDRSVDRSTGRDAYRTAAGTDLPMPPGGKIKASSVLMSLISCGSISFRDCGAATRVVEERGHGQGQGQGGFSLVSHYKARLPRSGNRAVGKDEETPDQSCAASVAGSSFRRMAMEDREYFSGSLIETRRDDFSALKRSSSYNADRNSRLKLADQEEIDGVRAKCIPRKSKMILPTNANKKEITGEIRMNRNDATQQDNNIVISR